MQAKNTLNLLAEALQVNPHLSAEAVRGHGLVARNPELEGFLARLRAAGLPERHFSSDPFFSAKPPLALLRSVSIDEKTDEVAWIASAEQGIIL